MQNLPANLRRWNPRAIAEAGVESEHERSNELAKANQWLQFQVSERERAEEGLRQLIEGLETRVEERTADLVAATLISRARLRREEDCRSSCGRHKRWKALAPWQAD
jgi:hypothetical protein